MMFLGRLARLVVFLAVMPFLILLFALTLLVVHASIYVFNLPLRTIQWVNKWSRS